jgi:hypothetical protein
VGCGFGLPGFLQGRVANPPCGQQLRLFAQVFCLFEALFSE